MGDSGEAENICSAEELAPNPLGDEGAGGDVALPCPMRPGEWTPPTLHLGSKRKRQRRQQSKTRSHCGWNSAAQRGAGKFVSWVQKYASRLANEFWEERKKEKKRQREKGTPKERHSVECESIIPGVIQHMTPTQTSKRFPPPRTKCAPFLGTHYLKSLLATHRPRTTQTV